MSDTSSTNILIFGGSSGIGLAVAHLALQTIPNANIILTSSSQSKLDSALSSLHSSPSTASSIKPETILSTIVADLSNSDSHYPLIESILKQSVQKFTGLIDHIIFTAGDSPSSSMPKGYPYSPSNDDLISILNIRVFAGMALGSLSPHYMPRSRRSSLTYTSGVQTLRPQPGRGRISSMAAAIEGMTRGLAVDLAPVRVNCIGLGYVHTPLLDGYAPRGSEMEEKLKAMSLVREIAEAEEVAEAYLYCMKCAFVDGSMIWCDGGAMLA